MVKPFSPVELTARVKAHIQIHRSLKEGNKEEVIIAGLLKIYPGSYRVYKGEQELELTGREFKLLLFLARNPDIVFSREQLVLKVWGSDSDVEPGNVDNYISFLRKRLRELKSSCQIKTIYGSGYRLEGSHA